MILSEIKGNALIDLPKRGVDAWGDGSYLARRGSRKHKGIDYACKVDAQIASPVWGKVTKIGIPYRDSHLDYVQVTDRLGNHHRIMYIEPRVRLGEEVSQGELIGLAQGVSAKYTTPDRYMKNHVHYEIITPQGVTIDPEEYTA